MALWVCRGCSAAYAVGLPRCPQCCGTDAHEEGDATMAKITVHGGASNAAQNPPAPPAVVEEVPCPGNSSSPSETKPELKPAPSEDKPRRRAKTTGSPSSKAPEEPGTADSAGDATPAE